MKNIQNNNGKHKKKFRPMGKVWERHGRGHGSELFFFLVFPWFFAVWPKTSRTQKKEVQTHGQGLGYPHTNQKTKKPKNQETKKPKKQKNKKNKIAHPKGRGSDAECWVLSFCFFFCFLVFCFFVFLVCVWIAIADVPSRDCQALSVVALEVGQAKTKKTKKTKNQDCTPQGEGVRCRVLGLVFLFFCFFWFFVFLFFGFWFFGLCVDSHCRCAKQRLPGTVSGCTRSKVDTLQYSNVCYDIVHSANEQQRGMEFNFVRLRHMLLDLSKGNAAICALPQWPVL